jgi:4-diphosphocytidyl-2-C-methyl-D-erythritol kinase
MRGIGDVLSQRIALPRLAALLVNPGVPVATKDVFGTLDLRTPPAEMAGVRPSPGAHPQRAAWGNDPASLIEELASLGNDNDLEEPAIRLQPVIAEVLRALAALPGCRLARMSGSGATCFGLFETLRAARLAARSLRAERSAWWIRATVLGG